MRLWSGWVASVLLLVGCSASGHGSPRGASGGEGGADAVDAGASGQGGEKPSVDDRVTHDGPLSRGASWSRAFGGKGNCRVRDVARAIDGSVYVAGLFSGKVDFDSGSEDVLLTADANTSAFLLKLSDSGDFSWLRAWGAPDAAAAAGWASEALALAPTTHGVVVGGQTSGTLRFAAPLDAEVESLSDGFAPFLASFDASGSLDWTKTWAAPRGRVGSLSLVDQTLVLSGQFSGTLGWDGAELVSAGEGDCFLATLEIDGSQGWWSAWGGPRTEYDCASRAGAAGIASVGSFDGEVDFGADSNLGKKTGVSGDAFLLETDSDGSRRFVRTWGGSGIDNAIAVALLPDGYVVAGEYYGDLDFGDGAAPTAQGHPSAYVARFTLDGSVVWHRTWEPQSSGVSDGFAIFGIEATDDELIVHGGFSGSIDFDGTELSSDDSASTSARDAFVLIIGGGSGEAAGKALVRISGRVRPRDKRATLGVSVSE